MATFKSQQLHLMIQGHPFHFASYKGRPANLRRAQLAYPAMWYLITDGRRCPVLPCDPSRSPLELDAALRDYAEDNALGPFAGQHGSGVSGRDHTSPAKRTRATATK